MAKKTKKITTTTTVTEEIVDSNPGMSVYILLDRSGSMNTQWDEALSSINAYNKELKKTVPDARVNVFAFDSFGVPYSPTPQVFNHTISWTGGASLTTRKTKVQEYQQPIKTNNAAIEKLRYDVLAKNFRDLTRLEVEPRGGTPLYDAIGYLYNQIIEENAEKVVVVVMTDGEENSSTEYNKNTARIMFDALRNRDYQIVFLGANFDAFGQAHSVGTMSYNTLNSSTRGLSASMVMNATRSAQYAATGTAFAGYTDEERAKVA